jgi:transposase
VAGLRQDGIVAPFVLDGPINRHAFETYVARVLVPELRPGDVVIMDNLPNHKGPRVRELIEAKGASLRYLPPYSPDFNPIENAFAKLKALLRKAAERTVDGLWAAIGRLVDLFTPPECAQCSPASRFRAAARHPEADQGRVGKACRDRFPATRQLSRPIRQEQFSCNFLRTWSLGMRQNGCNLKSHKAHRTMLHHTDDG